MLSTLAAVRCAGPFVRDVHADQLRVRERGKGAQGDQSVNLSLAKKETYPVLGSGGAERF